MLRSRLTAIASRMPKRLSWKNWLWLLVALVLGSFLALLCFWFAFTTNLKPVPLWRSFFLIWGCVFTAMTVEDFCKEDVNVRILRIVFRIRNTPTTKRHTAAHGPHQH
jgi:hypothetical protein